MVKNLKRKRFNAKNFFMVFVAHHSVCPFLFHRVMWIIISVSPNMMHIFLIEMFGFALFIVLFQGVRRRYVPRLCYYSNRNLFLLSTVKDGLVNMLFHFRCL